MLRVDRSPPSNFVIRIPDKNPGVSPLVILSVFQLQDGSLSLSYDIKGVWCRRVTFRRRLQSSSGRTRLFWCKYSDIFRFPRMNVEWLVQRSHLSLIRQNSVHPSERELVITGLQGTITEYCFRERLNPSCFVFARRDTSEETDWRPAADGLQLGVKSAAVLPNSCNFYSFVSPSFGWIVKPGKWGRCVTLWSSKTGTEDYICKPKVCECEYEMLFKIKQREMHFGTHQVQLQWGGALFHVLRVSEHHEFLKSQERLCLWMQHEFSAPLSHAHTGCYKRPHSPSHLSDLHETIKYVHFPDFFSAGFSMLG